MIKHFKKSHLKRTKSIDFAMPKLSDKQKSSSIWNKLQIKFKLTLFNHNSNPIFFHHPLTNVVNLKGKKSYKKNCKVLYKFYIGILPNAPLTIMICVTWGYFTQKPSTAAAGVENIFEKRSFVFQKNAHNVFCTSLKDGPFGNQLWLIIVKNATCDSISLVMTWLELFSFGWF